MSKTSRILCVLGLSACNISCSGGDSPVERILPPPPLPGQPQVTVEGETKQLIFSWSEVAGADYYKLLENPDGHSGFSQVGGDIPAGQLSVILDVSVHLADWPNVLFAVEACNVSGCSDSSSVGAADVMLNTIGQVTASDSAPRDEFGRAVAISADGATLIVGARSEDSASSGINGDEADNSAVDAGAAYVYRLQDSRWVRQAYIKASNPEGQVYGPETNWGDYFGWSLDLSADGNVLVIGAPLEDSDSNQVNGDQSDNSALGAGAAYVFEFDGVSWSQTAYLKASNSDADDRFGIDVSMSEDGDTIAVGAHFEDSSATGVGGNQSDDSSSESGAVYLFRRDAQGWRQEEYIKASNAGGNFGYSVDLAGDGNSLGVGARSENSEGGIGAVFVFRFTESQWIQQAHIKASQADREFACSPSTEECLLDMFGSSVALSSDGDTLAVGAPNEDSASTMVDGDQKNNDAEDAGAAYIFRFDGTDWQEQAYIKAFNTEAFDRFSNVALAADGNTLAVGAIGESSNAKGVGGDQYDNSNLASGAVYVYLFAESTWIPHSYVKAVNEDRRIGRFGTVALSGTGNTLAVGAAGSSAVFIF